MEESTINLGNAFHSALSRRRLDTYEKHADFPLTHKVKSIFPVLSFTAGWLKVNGNANMSATCWNKFFLVRPSGSINSSLPSLTFLN